MSISGAYLITRRVSAALAVLEQHRIACAPVLSVVDTLNHPYFKARNMVRTVPDPILGEVTIPGFPLKFSAYPDLPTLRAPLLGQHGGEVLKEYLQYSDMEIARLQQSGILYREDR
ncbi:MAG TPA: CoA transferase [Candidatus Binatia bacterium]|nr:CoA transferase [Candidatus Binatia bacterium]